MGAGVLMESAAITAERTAYRKIKQLLGNPRAIAEPRGNDMGFPDFGFTFKVEGKVVDLHFEFKMNRNAPMGSSRRWRFDGEKFTVPDAEREEEILLMLAMNSSPECINNGRRLLGELRKHFDERVKDISTSTFGVERDTKARRQKMEEFKKKAGILTIAKGIENSAFGAGIIQRYRRKWREVLRPSAAYSMLFFVIGDSIWFVDELGSLDYIQKQGIARLFGAEQIPELKGLRARVEARISPKITEGKMDVIAITRLTGDPQTQGLQIF
jgi:hypothetical protein